MFFIENMDLNCHKLLVRPKKSNQLKIIATSDLSAMGLELTIT